MQPNELTALAVELFGAYGWQTRLAERLEVDGSTVRRWVSGAVPIPNPVAVAVRCMYNVRELENAQTRAKREQRRR
jgi:hypothetical protein